MMAKERIIGQKIIGGKNIEQKIIDEKIRSYAGKQRLNLPGSYTARMEALIEECRKKDEGRAKVERTNAGWTDDGQTDAEPKKWWYFPKPAVVVLAICILAAAGTAVYGSVNYIRERMEGISDVKQQEYYEGLQESEAMADAFSRDLTKEEQERMRRLEQEYRSEGLYPQGAVTEISDESQADDQKVCFLAETSTFYLPERTLTDEELLEIIDFYYARDYSLSQMREAENQKANPAAERITREEAVSLASNMVERLFDVDTEKMKTEQKYEVGMEGGNAFSTEYVFFADETNRYSVTVDMQTGCVGSVERDLLTEQGTVVRYASDIKADETLYQEKGSLAEQNAREFLGYGGAWQTAEIVYATDQNQILRNGVVNYYFITEDGQVCAVSYSCAAGQIYQFRFFTEEGMRAKRAAEEKQLEGGKWQYFVLRTEEESPFPFG